MNEVLCSSLLLPPAGRAALEAFARRACAPPTEESRRRGVGGAIAGDG